MCYISYYLTKRSEYLVFTYTFSKKYVHIKHTNHYPSLVIIVKYTRGILKLEGICNTRLSDFDGLFSIIDIRKRSKRSLYT